MELLLWFLEEMEDPRPRVDFPPPTPPSNLTHLSDQPSTSSQSAASVVPSGHSLLLECQWRRLLKLK